MPPPKIHQPQFSPYGRYMLDVDLRRVSVLSKTPTEVHDTENYKPECLIEEIPTGSQSRFNNIGWATQRGFVKCSLCFASKTRVE